MVTDAGAPRRTLCRIFARGCPAVEGAGGIVSAMTTNRIVAAVAAAGLLGVGAAALTLPAGGGANIGEPAAALVSPAAPAPVTISTAGAATGSSRAARDDDSTARDLGELHREDGRGRGRGRGGDD
jgi:hypothetical protein